MSRLSRELREDLGLPDLRLALLAQSAVKRHLNPDRTKPRSLEDWAIEEAVRLTSRDKGRQSATAASRAAARRAEGMQAAAEALRALVTDEAAPPAQRLIPSVVAAEVTATAICASEHDLIDRVAQWLVQNPHVLKSCRSGLAAVAAVAPIAKVASQLPDHRDAALETVCELALASLRRERRVSTSSRPLSALPTRQRRRFG